jgi:hypothetical protein
VAGRNRPPGAAVLAYIAPRQRRAFAEAVQALGSVWLSNEGPDVLPGIPITDRDPGHFVLAENGTRAIARTDAHGTWLRWLP